MIDIVNFKGEQFPLSFAKVHHASEFLIVTTSDEEKIRKTLEDKRVDILAGAEGSLENDGMRSRRSGLNQVTCQLARKNGIAIGFFLHDLLVSNRRHILLGRMQQNVSLCRKYKVKMVLASFASNKFEMRAPKDLLALGRMLGMTAGEAKQAMQFARKQLGILVRHTP